MEGPRLLLLLPLLLRLLPLPPLPLLLQRTKKKTQRPLLLRNARSAPAAVPSDVIASF